MNERDELTEALRRSTAPAGLQRRAVRREAGLARRPHRAGRVRGRRVGRQGRGPRRNGAVLAGPHRRDAGADRRRVVRASRADRRRVPQLPRTGEKLPPETLLIDRAYLLTLTAPEMTVLVGGLRVLNANFGQSRHGVFTDRPGDADQRLLRQPARHRHGVEDRRSRRRTSTRAATAPRARSSGPRPRSTSSSVPTRSSAPSRRSTRSDDSQEKFVRDFVAAWTKVMNLDRFDLA